jgi:alpha-1,4-glucan branching enzyme GlgB, N-terminal domain
MPSPKGRHSDPFRYFGPHVENDSSVVRVFLPDAEGVAIVDEQGKPRRKPCAFGRMSWKPTCCSAGCELAPHHPLTLLLRSINSTPGWPRNTNW